LEGQRSTITSMRVVCVSCASADARWSLLRAFMCWSQGEIH